MNNKKCIKCLANKDLSSFYKDNRHKDKLYSICKDCHNISCSIYHHTDKYIDYQLNYVLDRYHNDIQYRKQKLIRSGLIQAIKNNQTVGKAIDTLGCSVSEFKLYIESKFKKGMTWDNWGKTGWNLDHIKPLCLFDLTRKKEYNNACHYTNIQPLWWKENIQKGKKI